MRKKQPLITRKFTFDELQELAKCDDFGEILTAAGVPDTPVPENVITAKNLADGVEFNRATFDEAAYRKYQRDFFKK